MEVRQMVRPAASLDEKGTTAGAIRTVAHASADGRRSSAAQKRVLDQLTEMPMREAAGVVSTFVSQQLGTVRDEVLAVMLARTGGWSPRSHRRLITISPALSDEVLADQDGISPGRGRDITLPR
jgi:hypothetical protein